MEVREQFRRGDQDKLRHLSLQGRNYAHVDHRSVIELLAKAPFGHRDAVNHGASIHYRG